MKTIMNRLDELSGEQSSCKIVLYAIIDEMLTGIFSVTGVSSGGTGGAANAGAAGASVEKGVVFPSSISGGKPRNNPDDRHKIA
jgi:hypothetical protein